MDKALDDYSNKMAAALSGMVEQQNKAALGNARLNMASSFMHTLMQSRTMSPTECARAAVEHTDALLAELEKGFQT